MANFGRIYCKKEIFDETESAGVIMEDCHVMRVVLVPDLIYNFTIREREITCCMPSLEGSRRFY